MLETLSLTYFMNSCNSDAHSASQQGQSILDFRFYILDFRIEALTPQINSGACLSDTGFLFIRPESAFGMNPGACILDAFGQKSRSAPQ
ncbi:hypothetical protein QUA30_12940 [Microcoleus sp. Pol14C2]|uniref:hypothetical protein n=1 Tax=unclassified Microcoleus TaxID=2642155 RepID=UPI002FD0E95C